ncbi:oligosaccharide flippase family protein [Patescibacteria group bacterium]
MKKLLNLIASITKTQTIKDAAIVLIGMIFSTIFSALSIFLLARFLGPTRFGLYTAALSLAVIVIDAVDLAIGGSIVNFGARSDQQANSFVKYGFFLKLTLGFIIGAIFALVSQPLASWLHPQIKTPLLLSSLFIPIIFLLRFPRSLLQAKKKFIKDSGIEVIISLLRLGSVIGFYYFFKLTVITALFSYLFGALGALLIGTSFISWKFLRAKITDSTKKEFFHFQKWLTLGFVLAAIHGRIDSTILLKLAGPAVTGIYQAAYRFFMPAIQLAAALSLVFAPRFASFSDAQTSRVYLIKAGKLTLGLASLVFLIIPLAPWFVKIIFGSEYSTAVLPTQILSLGFFAFIAGAPFVSHLIYAVNKTKTFFYLSLLQLILIVSLNFILIPKFQAVGAAIATSSTLLILNLLTATLALKSSKS